MERSILLRFPETVATEAFARIWNESEGSSRWFEWNLEDQQVGGRLTPNEDDVDLELWLENRRGKAVPVAFQVCPVLAGTMFADGDLERTWIHTAGTWKRMADTDRGKEFTDDPVVAVTSPDSRYVFAIAWPHPRSILTNTELGCVHADPILPECPPGRRVHVRGKLYLIEGTLDDLLARVRRELP
jgi:hypothetical protein